MGDHPVALELPAARRPGHLGRGGGHTLRTTAALAAGARPRLPTGEAALSIALVGASAATVDKYAGAAGAAAYAALVLLAGPPALRAASRRLPSLLPGRSAWWAAAGVLVVLAVLFAVVYPHANTHDPLAGSDRDDAADLGARAILHGRFPYDGRTYLGNPISQFPGGLLLAVPFVLLGHSAYAAFFWLPVLFLLLAAAAAGPRTPLLLLVAALVASPVLVREVVTGGDLVANSVAVIAAAWLLLRADARGSRTAVLAAGVLLGVALSWRLTFLFVLPPLLVALARRSGLRTAVEAVLAAGAGFAAVTLPFYLAHPGRFTPVGASDKLQGFDGAIPGGARLVIAAGLVLSVALALGLRSSAAGVFGQTALVQAFFLAAVVALASGHGGGLDLGPLVPGYGVPVLLLALAALPVGARPRERPC